MRAEHLGQGRKCLTTFYMFYFAIIQRQIYPTLNVMK